MVFTSSVFLYLFLPAILGLYYLSPRSLRTLTIALCSYVFYGWWRPDFVLLMLFSTVLDYGCGRGIERSWTRGSRGRRWLLLSVICNLSLLGWFKYANFGIESFNAVLSAFGASEVSWTRVVLPIGISFYTFQTMSYTIDVYRRHAPTVKYFRDFMCYVAMFPQLVAGPIVRYRTMAEQLRNPDVSFSSFYHGVLYFQTGLAKKVLIADTLSSLADQAFAADALSAGHAWTGLLAYTFQIYFDFSGYSDMAIGLGLMFGFRFPVNFIGPYRATSITDFWRRWHVSLSTWLRDYLYVSLGGNRKGTIRTYVNLMLTMLLGGLWHGANWTFLAWGTYQGLWLIIERARGRRSLIAGTPAFVRVSLTFILVMLGWVLFRAPDAAAAAAYFTSLAGASGVSSSALDIRVLHLTTFAVAAIIVWGLPTSQTLVTRGARVYVLAIQVAFILAILQLHYQSHVPFLYFQF